MTNYYDYYLGLQNDKGLNNIMDSYSFNNATNDYYPYTASSLRNQNMSNKNYGKLDYNGLDKYDFDSSTLEPTPFDWNMENTLDVAKIGLGTFNSWLAYKNYREQAKNNRFNRKLGRANYTNAAKAYNENLESKYRARQVNRGSTTGEIDEYLQENEDFRRRLARTTL